ncbi:MAG: adenylate kinase [Planctomycetaceae bacterium]|jgi:adenylate kinase|nr:adenylate kinase [Planctomycetaceae bacterium]
MRIVFIGPPGSGKGTQAVNIIKKYKPVHLSTGDMLRAARAAKTEIGLQADKYMSSGQLVPDDVIVGIISERLKQEDCQAGYLLDGFPRTIAQAEALDKMLAEKKTPLDAVLELQVPDDELFRRLAERAEKEGRSDDTPEVIKNRLKVYNEQTSPLLAYYGKKNLLKSFNGLGTVEEVFARIETILDSLQK